MAKLPQAQAEQAEPGYPGYEGYAGYGGYGGYKGYKGYKGNKGYKGYEGYEGYLAGEQDTAPPEDMLELGNINLRRRPVVLFPNGQYATVRSAIFNIDGVETLLPTIGPNGEDWTVEQAVEAYKKTGQHLGKFKSPDAADKYAQMLHREQDRLYRKKADALRELHGTPPDVLEQLLQETKGKGKKAAEAGG